MAANPNEVESRIDWAVGDASGLSIPAHADALRAAGADCLTEAFRAFGSIAPDNAVTAIRSIEPCAGGSTGQKLFLSVDYARDEPGLHRDLFVKFSRDFDDKRRDWQRTEMQSEARFEALAHEADFPISVPKPYFADYEATTGTGLIVTERIFFGENGIEPHRRKCMDHKTLDEPLPYYRAVVTALARLAGAQKAGRLAADLEQQFPFDPATGSSDPIRIDANKVRLLMAQARDFAKRCPQLLPPEVRSDEFMDKMERDALKVLEHEDAIRGFLVGDPDLIALCHWNAHIDNCLFWRDDAGELHCGLIDWGRVGQLTFGAVLWGGLSAAHHDVWDHHFRDLLGHFLDEYHAHGGPRLSVETLEVHLTLHMALMAVARMLVFPEVILFRLPEAEHASDMFDPIFETSDPARNCLHIYTAFLKYWRRRDFGAHIDALLAEKRTSA
jgi:hypothetical protein